MSFDAPKYRPKKPCKHCGTSLRYQRNNQCVKCTIERNEKNKAAKRFQTSKDNWKTKMEGVNYAD